MKKSPSSPTTKSNRKLSFSNRSTHRVPDNILSGHIKNQHSFFYPIINASISAEKFESLTEFGGEIWLKDCGGIDEEDLFPNQFICLEIIDKEKFVYLRYVAVDKPLKFLRGIENISGIRAKNIEQQMALDLLMDPEVKLITMTGGAGCGKTICALAGAMYQLSNPYGKIVISRPIVPLGRELGFIPGTLEEKMMTWMDGFKDNLAQLLMNKSSRRSNKNADELLMSYLESGTIEIQALPFIRGRTFNNSFIIFDEAQNMNDSELKAVISRAGNGTKIIICGDIEQSDILSSGLANVVEKFKPYSIAAHIDLIHCERSELASIAIQIL